MLPLDNLLYELLIALAVKIIIWRLHQPVLQLLWHLQHAILSVYSYFEHAPHSLLAPEFEYLQLTFAFRELFSSFVRFRCPLANGAQYHVVEREDREAFEVLCALDGSLFGTVERRNGRCFLGFASHLDYKTWWRFALS